MIFIVSTYLEAMWGVVQDRRFTVHNISRCTKMADDNSEVVILDHDVLSTQNSEGPNGRERSLSPFTSRLLRRKMMKKIPLWIKITRLVFVTFLGILVIVFTVMAHVLTSPEEPDSCANQPSGTYLFDYDQGDFRLCHSGEERLRGKLGHSIFSNPAIGVSKEIKDGTTFAFTFSSVIWTLKLKPSPSRPCVKIEWRGETSHQSPLRDCFSMINSTWYGGYETYEQQWPIDTNSSRKMMPFLSNNTYKHRDGFGSVIHPVWLSSNGVVLFVDREVPLHISTDQANGLCLQSVPYALGCTPEAAQEGTLLYTVCQFSDIVAAAKHFLHDSGHVNKPTSLPDLEVFKTPMWSTGVYLGVDINEANICGYVNQIVNATRPFPISKLGIDSGYSRKYGDFDVNATKFSKGFGNISQMAKANNFNLTAWVHPFVNYDTQAFKLEMQNRRGIFLPGGSRETTALVEWWRGQGALVNFEMDAARDWFRDKILQFVHSNSLDSLRFDAGESEYLPDCLYFPDSSHPATYTQEYINLVSNFSFNTSPEVRVGYFSQDKPIFVRMLTRSSTWGLESGLHSVLTTALTLSLVGYNYIIPDVIGGNGECHDQRLKNLCNTAGDNCKQMNLNCDTTFCEEIGSQKELYIRWMQMATFLPVMHFSIPPWAFNDSEFVKYARSLVKFHSLFVDQCIKPSLKDMVTNGISPLVQPVWWLDPKSKEALNINDQFVIDNKILVAPVIKPQQVSRAVYLPPGNWRKCWTSGKQPNCEEGQYYSNSFNITINLTDEMVYFKNADQTQTDGIC